MRSPAKLHEHDPAQAAAHGLGVGVEDLGGESGRAALERAWTALAAPHRAVLSTLAAMGGEAAATWLLFEAEEELASLGQPMARLHDGLEDLWERGVIARDRQARTYFVPAAFLRTLQDHCRRQAFDGLPGVPPPPPVVDDHALACAASLVRSLPVKLTREGRPHVRALQGVAERMAPLLGPAPAARAEDLILALVAAGLLVEHDGALHADPDRLAAWATLEPQERTEAALALGGEDAAIVLRQLRLLAPGAAWTVSLVARTLRRCLLCRSRGAVDPPVPAAFAQAVALRSAAAVTALQRAGLAAPTTHGDVALTALGRTYPGAPPLDPPTRFHVGPDLSVLIPRGLPARVHVALGALAALESADVVSRYRLDEARVLDALESGSSAAQVVHFLETHATPALPPAVRDDVLRWCSRSGEVRSHEGVVVTCAVASRHDELAAIAARSALRVEVVAPGVAVVDPRDHAAFCDELRRVGFVVRRRAERPRGAAAAAPSGSAPGATAAATRADVDALPAWGEPAADVAARRATPPPRSFRARLKQKYCRDFGSAQLAVLDVLDLDVLLDMEERGRVRQYLSGVAASAPPAAVGLELSDLVGPDLVPMSAARARALLQQAAAAGLTCQVGYAVRPGQRTRLAVVPLAVTDEASGAYLRARAVSSGEERLIAVERIHGLRILTSSGSEPLRPRLTR